jgi:hypothetical protein
MVRKRKASPKVGPGQRERRSKRKESASINRESKECSGYGTASGTSHFPSQVATAVAIRERFEPRKVLQGKTFGEDLTNLIEFLETITRDDDFLFSNNVTEISSTLKRARHSLGRDAPAQEVPEHLVEHAETLFDALKARCAPKLSQILVNFAEKVKPKSTLCYLSLINWYYSIDRYLHDLHDYACEYGLGAEWEWASSIVKQKYEERSRILRLQGAVNEHLNFSTVESSSPEQSVESAEQSPCPTGLLTSPRDAAKANKILDHLIAYYERQIVKETRTETSDIFRDLHTIKLCIAKLFSDSVELKRTLESLLGKDRIHKYQAWRLRYEAIWAAPAITEIQKRFRCLKNIRAAQPLGRTELIFSEFAKDLEALAMECNCPESASLEDWNYLAPRLMSVASATKAANDLEQEYLAFQDEAYAGTELTRLWLLVWRTLKAVKLPLPAEPEETFSPGQESRISKIDAFEIERLFFESDGHPSPNCISLWNSLQRGDVNNPQWIEGFVSKYCNHVAKCHDEKERYYWQFSAMGSKPVPAIVVSTLQISNTQPIAHPEWNKLLHRVVLRLHHLLGDGKVLKRWWFDKETQSLAYLDVEKSSTGMRERGQGQSTGGAPTTDGGISNKENDNYASDRSSGRSVSGNPAGGATGNGGQDGEGSSDSNGDNRDSQGRISKSSSSAEGSASSNDEGQDNKPAHADNLLLATKEDPDAFARNSISPGSPQFPPLGPENDDAAAAEVQRLLDEFPDTIPVSHMAPSSSPLNPSDQENVVPFVDAGRLATRVLPSAFPYVNYPLGETRASERAMSMQISREMRQNGIVTSGPHVEDVQNVVPQPLRLAPNPEDDVFATSSTPGIIRRSVGAFRLFRPLPSIRPEPLPTLPPRRSPRRPTPSPLTANRDGTAGVQRARHRGSHSPGSRAGPSVRSGSPRASNSSFQVRRSWVCNTLENYPWDSANQAPNPPPNTLQDLASIRVLPEAPRDTTAGPPSQSSGVFIDQNNIRRPISPTPQNGERRTQVTNRNITAATVQGSPERGASNPPFVEHPGHGQLVGAGPEGDRGNDIAPWEWIPQDNPHYQAFLEDDRARVNRGDTARLAAHRAINALEENEAGQAITMDIYQLLRARYEWPLTHDYQFPQHVPGYYHPPVTLATPRMQRYRPFRGGPGTAPGYLTRNPPGRPESDEMYRRGAPASAAGSSPWFEDRRPDPNLLNRAARPSPWGSWNGDVNTGGGNQDFDLYASPGDGSDQPGPDQQVSQSSVDARRELLRKREGGHHQASSRSSVSTLNLPSPSHLGQPTDGQRIFRGSENDSRQGSNKGSRHGSASTVRRPARPASRRDRRGSGASSLGRKGSSLVWPRGSENASQPTSRPTSRNGSRYSSRSPEPFNPVDRGTQTAPGPRLTFSNIQTTSTQPPAIQDVGSRPTPTREQYMQMTVRQLRDEITHRGGQPQDLRQRKEDFVQALLDYDAEGNYGNAAQPRRRATAIAPHPTLSPRALRPREASKVVKKK